MQREEYIAITGLRRKLLVTQAYLDLMYCEGIVIHIMEVHNTLGRLKRLLDGVLCPLAQHDLLNTAVVESQVCELLKYQNMALRSKNKDEHVIEAEKALWNLTVDVLNNVINVSASHAIRLEAKDRRQKDKRRARTGKTKGRQNTNERRQT